MVNQPVADGHLHIAIERQFALRHRLQSLEGGTGDEVTFQKVSAVAATLNNLGPGLGDVAGGFGGMVPAVKWASVCAMLLGRLEIFTLLVLFTPAFWQR